MTLCRRMRGARQRARARPRRAQLAREGQVVLAPAEGAAHEASREEALIKEARERALRRRRYLACAVVAAIAGLAVYELVNRGGAGLASAGGTDAPPRSSAPSPPLPQPLSYSYDGQIYVLGRDGTRRRLTRSSGHLYGIAWSSDGKQLLAYWDRVGMRFPAVVLITPKTQSKRTVSEAAEGPIWSPDGRLIAYQRDKWMGESGTNLYVSPSAGGPARRVASNALRQGVGGYESWSPDGRLVYLGADLGGLYVVRPLSGASPRQVRIQAAPGVQTPAASAMQNPEWSPDGSFIAFTADRSLYVVRPDGSGLRRLTDGSLPAWSPDGTRIAFVGGNSGPLYGVIGVDGTGLRRFAGCRCNRRGPGFWPKLSWSNDGSRIAFVSGAGNAISTVRPDGTGETQVLRLPSKQYDGPNWPLWRPASHG